MGSRSHAPPENCASLAWGAGGIGLLALIVAGLWGWHARLPSPAAVGLRPAGTPEARLRAAVVRRPRDPAAHAALGRYLVSVGRPVSALWELEEARTLAPGDDVSLRRDQAQALRLAGQRSLAIEELAATLAAHPAEAGTRAELAELLLATGRPAEALARLGGATASSLGPADAALLRGRAYHALGRLPEAEAAFRRYARLASPDTGRYEPLGRFLLASDRSEEARRTLMRDQRVSFRRAEFHYLLGLTYLRARPRADLGKAGGAFAVALRFDPRHVGARAALGQVFERQGDRESAAAQYEAAVRADPLRPAPHARLAALWMAHGRVPEALQQRGIALTLEDRLPDAERAFGRMLTTEPDGLDASQSLILTCVRLKRVDRAAPAIKALQRQPLDPALAERVAALYLISGSRTACRRLGEAWSRRQPEAAGPLRVLGRLAVDELRVPEGIRLFGEAWAREPDHAETAASLGLAWARVPSRANLERAREWLQRAEALAPTHARTAEQLGQVLQQLGRFPEARDAYLRALDLDPTLTAAAGSLARLAGRIDRAAHARLLGRIARALDDDRRDEEQLRQRVWDAAEEPMRAGTPSAEAHVALAQFLLRQGDLEKAESQLQQALESRPRWEAAERLRRTVTALLVWA